MFNEKFASLAQKKDFYLTTIASTFPCFQIAWKLRGVSMQTIISEANVSIALNYFFVIYIQFLITLIINSEIL